MTRNLARQMSRERKADAILNYSLLDQLPSTREEIEADWRNAEVQIAVEIMASTARLSDLAPDCFPYLESIWLDEIKHYLAFFNWIDIREQAGFWSSEEARKKHYFDACDKLRALLVDRKVKDRLENFASIKKHFKDRYLNEYNRFDPELARSLVCRKTARLGERINPQKGGEIYATEYSQKFYNNIIPAVELGDDESLLAVLQALQHGGSFAGGPAIVTAFEMSAAIAFLDGTKIQKLWRVGENVSRDTTF